MPSLLRRISTALPRIMCLVRPSRDRFHKGHHHGMASLGPISTMVYFQVANTLNWKDSKNNEEVVDTAFQASRNGRLHSLI